MPLSLSISEDGRRVVFLADGPVDGEELLRVHRQFLETRVDELQRCLTWFVDYSKAQPGDTANADIRGLSDIAVATSKELPRLAVAVWAPADLDFGLARMWEALSDQTGWDIRVFRSQSEATSWLNAVEQAVDETA